MFGVKTLARFDPVGATNYRWLWHRGYPLQLLPKRDDTNKRRMTIKVDVQADFWDGDPHIECRLPNQHDPAPSLTRPGFPIAGNSFAPFNSQNTFLSREILKDYFLYPRVGRMDDIWAAYYVQAKRYRVVFDRPSVYQCCNIHDLVHDMRQEYLGYEHNLALVCYYLGARSRAHRHLPSRTGDFGVVALSETF